METTPQNDPCNGRKAGPDCPGCPDLTCKANPDWKPEPKPVPAVGMGVTYHCGSDRYPYTIIEVLSPTRIKVQADKVVKWSPFPDSRGLAFEPNPDGEVKVLSRRKGGFYEVKGCPTCHGLGYTIGHRSAYRDPSF